MVFEFLKLPDLVQSEIVDYIDPHTKHMFSMFNHKTLKLVRSSKNYWTSINVSNSSDYFEIRILLSDYRHIQYEFCKSGDNCCTAHIFDIQPNKIHNYDEVFDISENFIKTGLKFLQSFTKHAVFLKKFSIACLSGLNLLHHNIQNLYRLKCLHIDIRDIDQSGFITVPQVLRIPEFVMIMGRSITFDNFCLMRASNFVLYQCEFNARNINEYLRLLENGDLVSDVRSATIGVNGTLDFGEIVSNIEIRNYRHSLSQHYFELPQSRATVRISITGDTTILIQGFGQQAYWPKLEIVRGW